MLLAVHRLDAGLNPTYLFVQRSRASLASPQLGQDCFGILDDLADLFPRVRLSTLTRTPLASQVRERLVRGTRVDATVGAAKCARLVLATLNTGKLSSRLCRGGTRAAV